MEDFLGAFVQVANVLVDSNRAIKFETFLLVVFCRLDRLEIVYLLLGISSHNYLNAIFHCWAILRTYFLWNAWAIHLLHSRLWEAACCCLRGELYQLLLILGERLGLVCINLRVFNMFLLAPPSLTMRVLPQFLLVSHIIILCWGNLIYFPIQVSH